MERIKIMHPQQPCFRLTRQAVLLGVIAAAYPMAGYCVAAGRADFVVGSVEAVAADGSRRTLSKGSEISVGDAISTAAGARAQVRFIDGGYVSLQPNTQFRVDQFNYQNKTDGKEQGFFSLLKGGLRAITGAIGKVNRNTYKVATPSATIGIRGTGYKAEIRDDGLFVSVGEGAISLTNNVGLLVVTAGNAAFVANSNTAPAPTTEQPQLPPSSMETISSPVAILLPTLPSMASGPGYTMAYAYMGIDFTNGSGALPNVSAIFNNSGQLLQFSDGLGISGDLGAGSVAFSATDGIIGWGRWTGYFTTTSAAGGSLVLTPGSFDYVIGVPTAVMPTSGTATYNLMGYTNPTATDGSSGWNVKGDLSVTFSTTNIIGVNMTVWNAVDNFTVAGSGVVGSGATFSGTISTTGTVCASGCNTSINGFFAGTNAERAGLSYQITDGNFRKIQGVAAFAKQ
jgi:hypothetical protein